MRKSFYFLPFVLLLSVFPARGQQFTIKVQSDSLRRLTLVRSTQNGILPFRDTIEVNASKASVFSFPVHEPAEATLWLKDDAYFLWLLPGHPLTVQLKKVDVLFKGPGALMTNYYKKKINSIRQFKDAYIERHPDYGKTEGDMTAFLDSVTVREETFLKTYFPSKTGPDVRQFIAWEKATILYSNLYKKLIFPGSDMEKFACYQKVFRKTKPAYAYSDQITFGDPLLLHNYVYQFFARQFVADVAFKKQHTPGKPFDFPAYIDFAMQTADQLTTDTGIALEIKILLLNKVAEEIVAKRREIWADKMNETIASLSPKTENERLQLVKQKIDGLIADTRFKKGSPAPDFVLKDLSGKSYTPADFKGKKIYMDIGASWCISCIAGIPSWNRLAEENKDKDIVFISVSLDDTREEWQQWLNRGPKGLQLHAQGFGSDFARTYLISSLPKCLLIDANGNMEDYDAPRPDSEEIADRLPAGK